MSIQDLAEYVFIMVVIAVISPYGIFLIKMAYAVLSGSPRPRIDSHRKAQPANHHRIEPEAPDMAALTFYLQLMIDERDARIAALEIDNAKLARLAWRNAGFDEMHTKAAPTESLHWDLLAIGLHFDPLPTWHEIRKAHRESVMHNHPDRGGNPETLVMINLAFESLKVAYKSKSL